MTGWKRYFYSILGWEYDTPADEKQKRQKYLVTEQIKNSNLKLTLRDELLLIYHHLNLMIFIPTRKIII
jgi:hypothetical protein